MTLATCNYHAFVPEMGVPVQISNGRPKWPLRYELNFSLPSVVPLWKDVTGIKSDEVFEQRYRGRLEWIGVDRIQAEMNSVAHAAGDDRLVLMCFEDLSKGKVCHRTMFARWWMEKTGEIVEEYGKLPKAATPEVPEGQERLF